MLAVDYEGSAKRPVGHHELRLLRQGQVTANREDWGLTWNVALETGGWLVGKEIEMEIELELVQVAEAVAELVPA